MYFKDRFSLENVLMESCEYEDSIYKKDTFWAALDEESKIKVSDKIASKTLISTRKRLQYLNKKGVFGDIPKTKGCIAKSEYYKTVKSSINFLEGHLYKAKGSNVNEVKKAFEICRFALTNIERNRSYFEQGYRENDASVILLYQTTSALVIEMLAIIFINTMEIEDDLTIKYVDCKKGRFEKSKNIKQLDKFNDICKNNKLHEAKRFNESMSDYEFDNIYNEEIPNFFDIAKHNVQNNGMYNTVFHPIKNIKNKDGSKLSKVASIGVLAIVSAGALYAIIMGIRQGIAYFFYKKNDISQSAGYLGDMVYANSLANEYDSTKSGKVSEKQKKLAIKIKKLGVALDSDNQQAEFNASNKLKDEDKKSSNYIEKQINPDTNDGGSSAMVTSTGNDDLFI